MVFYVLSNRKERMKNKRSNPLCRPSTQDNLSHKFFLADSGLQTYREDRNSLYSLEIVNHVTEFLHVSDQRSPMSKNNLTGISLPE